MASQPRSTSALPTISAATTNVSSQIPVFANKPENPRKKTTFEAESVPSTRMTTTAHVLVSNNDILNMFQQETRITPQVAKEIHKLWDMISSVPGVVKPIPDVPVITHMISRFAPPICDTEIPKIFQTPTMKLYDGTTGLEEYVIQYRERMETNPIPSHMKEACLWIWI
ncbi:hypothetical protein R6Q59_030996 [Mikania micrantha]